MLLRLVAPALGLVLLLTAALVYLINFSAGQLDEQTATHDRQLLDNELSARRTNLSLYSLDFANWDDMYLNAVLQTDVAWLTDSVGYLGTATEDVDAALVIGADRRLRYAGYAGRLGSIEQEAVAQLIDTMYGQLDPTAAETAALEGYIVLENQLFLYSAVTLLPESGPLLEEAAARPGRSVLALLRRMDEAYVAGIGEKLHFDDLSLQRGTPAGPATYNINSDAYLVWTPHRPGLAFFNSLRLPILLFLLLMLLTIGFFLTRAAATVRELGRANRTRAVFLSAVSHELKTPLNAISGAADLMRSAVLNPSQETHLRDLQASVRELNGKVEQILDYTRLETARFVLDNAPFDLRNCIEEMLAERLPDARANRTSLVCDMPRETWQSLVGDSNRLRQALSLMMASALSAAGSGQVRFSVASKPSGPDFSDLVFEFLVDPAGDAGKPLQLVDPNAEIDQQRDGSVPWDMVTAHFIIRAMGGTLTLVRQGPGSQRLRISMSLAVQDTAIPEPIVEPGKQSALLLSTDTLATRALCDRLAEHGVAMQTVSTASNALALVEQTAQDRDGPSLVIIDQEADGIDAKVLAGELREHGADILPPFLLLTDRPQSYDAVALRKLGFADMLEHPLVTTNIMATLDPFLNPGSDMPPNGSAQEKRLLSSLSILIAEDNKVNRALLERIVGGWGCDVHAVADGDEAVQAVIHSSFDCILMDYNMPRMDGADATQLIRNMGNDTPVIFVSAATDQQDIDRCLDAGMSAFVSKPVVPGALKKEVMTWTHSTVG